MFYVEFAVELYGDEVGEVFDLGEGLGRIVWDEIGRREREDALRRDGQGPVRDARLQAPFAVLRAERPEAPPIAIEPRRVRPGSRADGVDHPIESVRPDAALPCSLFQLKQHKNRLRKRLCGGGLLYAREAEADGDGRVDLIHDALVRVAHVLAQAAFVDGADLLEQDDGVLIQPHVVPGERNVRREPRLAGLAGDGGGDDGWRVFVAGVVLNDEHGACAALLAADHRAEIGIEIIAAFHVCIDSLHTPW